MDISAAQNTKRLITRAYIYVCLIAFPLFTGFEGYTAITSAKLAFYISVTAMWLLSLFAVSIKTHFFGRLRLSAIEICVLIYLALCCVSALASPYGNTVILGAGRFDGLLQTALSVCIFFGVSRYCEPENGFVFALAISMTVCCVIALLQLLNMNPLGLYPNGYTYRDMGIKYSGEFLGTIGNANLFSAFLALCLPVLTAFFIIGKRRRMFLLPVIALGAFCLFKCTVSAGKLALCVCALAAAPVLIAHKTHNKCLTLLFAALSVFAACFSIIFLKYFYTGTEGTLYEIGSVLRGNVEGSFGSSRIMIWRESLALVSERPVLGGGPGTVALRLDISFSRFVEETGVTLSSRVDNAHNVYLGILTDTGALSLAAYLAAICLTLINAVKHRARKPLSLVLACGLFCYWLQDFFGLGLFLVSPIMWILWGLTVGKKDSSLRSE